MFINDFRAGNKQTTRSDISDVLAAIVTLMQAGVFIFLPTWVILVAGKLMNGWVAPGYKTHLN